MREILANAGYWFLCITVAAFILYFATAGLAGSIANSRRKRPWHDKRRNNPVRTMPDDGYPGCARGRVWTDAERARYRAEGLRPGEVSNVVHLRQHADGQ